MSYIQFLDSRNLVNFNQNRDVLMYFLIRYQNLTLVNRQIQKVILETQQLYKEYDNEFNNIIEFHNNESEKLHDPTRCASMDDYNQHADILNNKMRKLKARIPLINEKMSELLEFLKKYDIEFYTEYTARIL